MKVSLIGYGQMGHMIEACAKERSIEVVSIIDPFAPEATHQEITSEALESAEAAICFTAPNAALDNIEKVLATKTPLVMGTTGWVEHMDAVRAKVEAAGVGMVYSSNFSIGVNLFFSIVEKAASIMNGFDLYDVFALEAHHNKKQDSPSGTAVTLGDILIKNLDQKTSVVTERLDRKIEAHELHFASVRGGAVPGTHAISFDSEFDSIELKHTARGRKGFAMGALLAAEWIKGQKGMFTERDMMAQLLS